MSLFDDDLIDRVDEGIIREFIYDNYYLLTKSSSLHIHPDGTVDVSGGGISMKHLSKTTELTNGTFRWGTIEGSFMINGTKINTLKGCPKKCHSFFINSDYVEDLSDLDYLPDEMESLFVDGMGVRKINYSPRKVNQIHLQNCNVRNINKLLKYLDEVEFLDISGNQNIRTMKLPPRIGHLHIMDCSNLRNLPDILKNVRVRNLSLNKRTGCRERGHTPYSSAAPYSIIDMGILNQNYTLYSTNEHRYLEPAEARKVLSGLFSSNWRDIINYAQAESGYIWTSDGNFHIHSVDFSTIY